MGKTIIAMWSGPRNLSTAMMRSFGNRADCEAMDEPFYAAYLAATGLAHPMADEIIADGETDPRMVVEQCLAGGAAPVSYQKHMTHHMIGGFDTKWIGEVINIFLIREPERVLASYARKAESVTAADIGFARQRDLFVQAAALSGVEPIVVDASDIRANPRAILEKLCAKIGIAFDEAMLSWEAGPRPEDGIWARHWYDAVWQSTGFAPPDNEPLPELPEPLAEIAREVRPHYEHLARFRLNA